MTISLAGARRALALGRGRLEAARLPRLHREAVHAGLNLSLALALVLAGSFAVRSALSQEIAKERAYYLIKASADGFSDRELAELMAGAGPGALKIAAAHDPDAPQAAWKRPPGWKRLDIDTVPTLDLGRLSMAEAQRINGVIPNSDIAVPAATPFVLKAGPAERARAVRCLTAAVYYEAALEPREGQEAVAQVVLNRMRHAGFPKSVCGVVFQGADRPGCQFSFACDGSMARAPVAWAWNRAKDVAERALDGYVMKQVGTATHYHTNWIMAAWTPTLVKVGQFGTQIFFRPTGPDGDPPAFQAPYGGGEFGTRAVDLIGRAPPKPPAAEAPLTLASADAAQVAGSGRVHAVIAGPQTMGASTAGPPMHAMIAMRAAAARAALAATPAPAIPSPLQAAAPATSPSAATAIQMLPRPAAAVAPAVQVPPTVQIQPAAG